MSAYCVIIIDEKLQVPYCKSGTLESGKLGVSVLAKTMEDAAQILLNVARDKGASEPTAGWKVGEETSTEKFITSIEISDILKREHNQVLKKIRNVLKRAEIDGIDMKAHISKAYRRCKNGVRHAYYRLDISGVDAFCGTLCDETNAEKLKQALSEK